MTPPWLPLRIDPRALRRESLQLHHACVLLASVPHSLLPHADDDSHTNFGVDADGPALRTWTLRRDPDRSVLLALAELELRWQSGAEVAARLPLAGQTMAGALAWADTSARRLCGAGVQRRVYDDLPPHPVHDGAPFDAGDTAARAELGRWFVNAANLFADLAGHEARLSPPRVWPHHFDLGALLPLADDKPELMLGVGFSPGDGYYDEPYFYCSPYPDTEAALPPLAGPGAWHTTDFTSAVVTGSALLAGGDPQRDARAWLASAVAACRAVLGVDRP